MTKANLAGSCKAMAILQDLSYHAIILQKINRTRKLSNSITRSSKYVLLLVSFAQLKEHLEIRNKRYILFKKIALLVCFNYMKTTVKSNRIENVMSKI